MKNASKQILYMSSKPLVVLAGVFFALNAFLQSGFISNEHDFGRLLFYLSSNPYIFTGLEFPVVVIMICIVTSRDISYIKQRLQSAFEYKKACILAGSFAIVVFETLSLFVQAWILCLSCMLQDVVLTWDTFSCLLVLAGWAWKCMACITLVAAFVLCVNPHHKIWFACFALAVIFGLHLSRLLTNQQASGVEIHAILFSPIRYFLLIFSDTIGLRLSSLLAAEILFICLVWRHMRTQSERAQEKTLYPKLYRVTPYCLMLVFILIMLLSEWLQASLAPSAHQGAVRLFGYLSIITEHFFTGGPPASINLFAWQHVALVQLLPVFVCAASLAAKALPQNSLWHARFASRAHAHWVVIKTFAREALTYNLIIFIVAVSFLGEQSLTVPEPISIDTWVVVILTVLSIGYALTLVTAAWSLYTSAVIPLVVILILSVGGMVMQSAGLPFLQAGALMYQQMPLYMYVALCVSWMVSAGIIYRYFSSYRTAHRKDCT